MRTKTMMRAHEQPLGGGGAAEGGGGKVVTKFLSKSFQVGTTSEGYRKGWDRIFGKEEGTTDRDVEKLLDLFDSVCSALEKVTQNDQLYEEVKKALETVSDGSLSWDESEMADAWLAFMLRWREGKDGQQT
jgi:hypothetical protein